MRGIYWRYFFFGILTVALVFGAIRIGKRQGTHSGTDVASVVKPSYVITKNKTQSKQAPTVVAKNAAPVAVSDDRKPASTSKEAAQTPAAPVASAPVVPTAAAPAVPAVTTPAPETSAPVAAPAAPETSAPVTAAVAPQPERPVGTPEQIHVEGGDCTSVEYRGNGPMISKISQAEWVKVLDLFHGAKRDLLNWLNTRRKELPDKTLMSMDSQIRNLRIMRPPTLEEPDLSWRGIGIYTQDAKGEPIIRIGGGFMTLVARQPARARFEMTRLVAQGWSPCELKQMSAGDVWAPLLACLQIKEDQSCGNGSYSEAGWGVSSVLAAVVAPPRCSLPAIKIAGECAKIIPLPTSIAQNKSLSEKSWKEARR